MAHHEIRHTQRAMLDANIAHFRLSNSRAAWPKLLACYGKRARQFGIVICDTTVSTVTLWYWYCTTGKAQAVYEIFNFEPAFHVLVYGKGVTYFIFCVVLGLVFINVYDVVSTVQAFIFRYILTSIHIQTIQRCVWVLIADLWTTDGRDGWFHFHFLYKWLTDDGRQFVCARCVCA